jgi:hypothetical protein
MSCKQDNPKFLLFERPDIVEQTPHKFPHLDLHY